MEQLLRERQEFENLLYDFLINENNGIIIENYNLNEINNLNVPNVPNAPNVPSHLNINLPIFVNVHLINVIPEDFWEPVRISFDINNLLDNYIYNECSICISNSNRFKIMKCCNQLMCAICADKWFILSVMCPYCNRDLREFI